MRVLVDTNAALDWLLERQPWFTEAEDFWRLLEDGGVIGHIVATSLTDIYYIARRLVGREAARIAVQQALIAFVVLPVDRRMLVEAIAAPGYDFEDNLQIVCAETARLDAVITRDPAGFRGSSILVLNPAEAAVRLR